MYVSTLPEILLRRPHGGGLAAEKLFQPFLRFYPENPYFHTGLFGMPVSTLLEILQHVYIKPMQTVDLPSFNPS